METENSTNILYFNVWVRMVAKKDTSRIFARVFVEGIGYTIFQFPIYLMFFLSFGTTIVAAKRLKYGLFTSIPTSSLSNEKFEQKKKTLQNFWIVTNIYASQNTIPSQAMDWLTGTENDVSFL